MSSQKQPEPSWWKRKWRLILYTVLLLIASVGNTVYFKRMTSAMPNYGWYLTQLSTLIYVPFFATMAGTGITQQVDVHLLRKFALMGVFDGLSGTLMVLGGVHTSGTLQVLFGQAVIPVTMMLSVAMLRKSYHSLQYVGATTIFMGIVMAQAFSGGGGGEENLPIFNTIFCLAVLPSAASMVFKEIAFRGFDGDLDVNVLQFWVAVFQVAVNFLGMPIYSLKILGAQQVPLQEMGSLARGGSMCLFFAEDQVITNCGLPDEKPCDHCSSAHGPVFMYLLFNLALNVFSILVVKHGSAALSFLVSTLRMPLSALAFSSTMIMGSEAVQPNLSDLLSLIIILAGLCSYRLGARQLKHQLRREAAEASDEKVPSPRNSWASPTSAGPSSPSSSSRDERRGAWKFLPLFTTGSLGNVAQPQFVLVHAPQPRARSADQVRANLIRRLGTASPLHSPTLRHLTPAQGAEENGCPDFSLTGLPP